MNDIKTTLLTFIFICLIQSCFCSTKDGLKKIENNEEISTQLTTPLLKDINSNCKITPPKASQDYTSNPQIDRTQRGAREKQIIMRMRHTAVRPLFHEKYQPPSWDDVKGTSSSSQNTIHHSSDHDSPKKHK